MENGHVIWNLECEESEKITVTAHSRKRICKVYIRFMEYRKSYETSRS